jgi:hypothetical protein
MSATKRICIYPKDIMRITGKSEKFSRSLMLKIKKSFQKNKYQMVSIKEFCEFTGLKLDEVLNLMY